MAILNLTDTKWNPPGTILKPYPAAGYANSDQPAAGEWDQLILDIKNDIKQVNIEQMTRLYLPEDFFFLVPNLAANFDIIGSFEVLSFATNQLAGVTGLSFNTSPVVELHWSTTDTTVSNIIMWQVSVVPLAAGGGGALGALASNFTVIANPLAQSNTEIITTISVGSVVTPPILMSVQVQRIAPSSGVDSPQLANLHALILK